MSSVNMPIPEMTMLSETPPMQVPLPTQTPPIPTPPTSATAPKTRFPHCVVASDEGRFPESLHLVAQPPKRVYIVGDARVPALPALAIVGARKATPYGLSLARRFARRAAQRGLVVVSGGAIGCDQAAHRGALEGGGLTVVVLGCGADVVYPARAGGLFEQVVASGGAILSEAPWGSSPSRWSFRTRNRLIAGLAQATLIVEAGLPSGTFSTADDTLAQGKEVLAVPGSIFARESQGSNHLIAQGAIPIIDDAAFDEALRRIFGVPTAMLPLRGSAGDAARSDEDGRLQRKVCRMLAQTPTCAEGMVGICGRDVVEVIRYLSSLELTGGVIRLRDGRYALSESALTALLSHP
jgi:DNA processing protein